MHRDLARPRPCQPRGAHDVAAQLRNAGRHLDAYPVLSDTNILCVTGQWTHTAGSGDSLGLNWYAFEPRDGSLKPLGTSPCDAGALQFSPDRKSLYLSAWFSHATYQVGLDAGGKPVVGAKGSGNGPGAAVVRSPDDRFLVSTPHLPGHGSPFRLLRRH